MTSQPRYAPADALMRVMVLTAQQTYEAFAKDITDDHARVRRFKKVGLWSLQLFAQALFMGMAGNLA